MNILIIAPLLCVCVVCFCHSDKKQRRGWGRPANLDILLHWTPLSVVVWFFPCSSHVLLRPPRPKETGRVFRAGHGGAYLESQPSERHAEGLQVQGGPELHSHFKAILGNVARAYLKKKKKAGGNVELWNPVLW